MDFSQVLIPVIVIAPLVALIAFAMKRQPAKRAPIPTLQPSPVRALSRKELTTSRSTTVVREITLSASYEKKLARVLKEPGEKGPLHQVPLLPPFYIGSRSELARAFALLDAPEPPRALAITSARELAGVGRTAFASVLARVLAERFSGGEIYVDLRGDDAMPSGIADAMRQVVRTLNPAATFSADEAALPAQYQKALTGRSVILLIDNVRPQPFVELLRPPAGCLLLITSREPAAFSRFETVALEPLSRLEAREFFRATGSRIAREPDKYLDLLAELSGFLPAAMRPNSERYQDQPSQSIDGLFDQLKKADAFKNPLSAALALTGKATAVAPKKAPQKAAREPDLFSKFSGPENAAGPEPASLEEEAAAARAIGNRAREARALAALGQARMQNGEPRSAVACFERWIEITRESGDRLAEADALGWLGAGWVRSGLPNRATGCFEAKIRIAREMGERGIEARAHGDLGKAQAELGEHQQAADSHAEQLRIAMEIQDRASEVDALEQLGVAWTKLKDIEKAATFHEKQLLAARETGDQAAECRALGHLGHVALHRGEIEDALAKYEAQLDLASTLGDVPQQSHAHASLGVAWARQGDLRKAVAHYEQQLAIARQTQNRLAEATAFSNIGSGMERLGDLAGAATAWESALAIYESLDSPSANSMRRWLDRLRKNDASG